MTSFFRQFPPVPPPFAFPQSQHLTVLVDGVPTDILVTGTFKIIPLHYGPHQSPSTDPELRPSELRTD